MRNIDGDWRSLNLHVRERKQRGFHQWRELPHFLPFMPGLMQVSLALQKKEVGGTDSLGLTAHLCWGAEPTCILYDVYGTLHFSGAQFLPNHLRVRLLLCTVTFTSWQLINCYWTFHIQCYALHLLSAFCPCGRADQPSSFISPSVPCSQCQIAQVANTDRECFATVTESSNYWLEVSLQDDSEQSFFSSLLK